MVVGMGPLKSLLEAVLEAGAACFKLAPLFGAGFPFLSLALSFILLYPTFFSINTTFKLVAACLS